MIKAPDPGPVPEPTPDGKNPIDQKTHKLKLEKIDISFFAPYQNNTETLTIEKNKSHEANFQWNQYSLLLSDGNVNPVKKQWYRFYEKLEAWGTVQPGNAQIKRVNEKGVPTDELTKQPLPESLTVQSIQAQFRDLLQKPDLEPNKPESMVEYINGQKPVKTYSPTEFKNTYENGTLNKDGTHFYVLVSKSNDILSPLGKKLGANPEMESAKKEPVTKEPQTTGKPEHGGSPIPESKGPEMAPTNQSTAPLSAPEQHTPNLQNLKS